MPRGESAKSTATERDSPRDQLIVTVFLLTVFGLLLGAGVKSKMQQAGFQAPELPWQRRNDGRWWEVGPFSARRCCMRLTAAQPWIPARQEPDGPLGITRFGMSPTSEYISMSQNRR